MGRGHESESGIYSADPLVRFGTEILTRAATGSIHIEGRENIEGAIDSGKPILFVFGPHRSHADGAIAREALQQAEFPLEIVVVQGKKLNDRLLTRTLVKGSRRVVVWPSTVEAETEEEIAERTHINRTAMKGSIHAVKNHESLLVFPEGTRSAAMISADPDSALYIRAVRGGLVIPAAIIGGDSVLPKHAVFPRRHTPTVHFGKPMDADRLLAKYADLQKEERHQRMIDDVMVEVARFLPEEWQGVYSERART